MKGTLTVPSRRELTKKFALEYKKCSKSKRTSILDAFIAATQYNRKYAIHILTLKSKQSRKTQKVLRKLSSSYLWRKY
jgi:hypothetical protein